ncbi:MAG: PAS domain-containing sensor histidine kinase, partial [Methyloceanibacter sp.]
MRDPAPENKISKSVSNVDGPPQSSSERDTDGQATVPAKRRRLQFMLGLIIMVLSLCAGLATYLVLTGLTPIVPTQDVVVTTLLINAVLVVAMIALIAWQVTGLWLAKRRHEAGAQLHVRIVSLFSVIAVVPAIALAIFASISLDRGLDHWFSQRTKDIIQNSIDVATAYLQEHGQVIRADTVGMAKDIDEAVELVRARPQGFGNFLRAQATVRAIPAAYLIDSEGKMLATAASIANIPYRAPPPEAMDLAKDGQVIVIAPGETSLVGAIK